MDIEDLEWIDSEKFFPHIMKLIKLELTIFPLMFIPPLCGMVYLIFVLEWNLCVWLILAFYLVLLGVVYEYSVLRPYFAAKRRREIEKYFLQCPWCDSYFSQEIWKEIARYLTTQGIEFFVNVPNLDIDNILRHRLDIVLIKIKIRISFYCPSYLGIDRKYSTLWIGIGSFEPENEVSVKFMEKLKREIKKVVEKIPERNPFCKICPGKNSYVCYGGRVPTTEEHFDEELAKSLFEMDPYKDEETLQYLVERKKRLRDEILTKEQQKEFIRFAKQKKGYEIEFGKTHRSELLSS